MPLQQYAASTKPSSTSLCDDEYYGPLIDSYIKSILKSGLLLDEDLEVLLSISKFRNFPERSGYKPSLSLLSSIIAIPGSSFLAKKLKMPLLAIPAVAAAIYFAVAEYKNEKRSRRNIQVIDELVGVITKIQKFIKNITRYMKTRCDLTKSDQTSSLLHGRNVEEFMKVFLRHNCDVLEFLINHLRNFTTYSPELAEDFTILEHLNYSNMSEAENLSDAENSLAYSLKTHDINILLFSKLLSYLGILFSSQTLKKDFGSILINETVPEIVTVLQQYYEVTKKQFLYLRHSTKKKSEIRLESEAGKRKNISKKLEATLVSSVNNLSVILEKSQNILDGLEGENERNIPEIGNALVDIRNHTFATYESLDLLCRLYGILSNSNVNQPKDRTVTKTPTVNDKSSDTFPTVNYDDNCEPIEEKFELYIGVDEAREENPVTKYEDSNAYLSLMLQELKQSLKQHERFVAAKNKRGSDDEDDTEIENRRSRKIQEQQVPKFNLKELTDYSNQIRVPQMEHEQDEEKETIPAPNLPAPPPPPLPSFSVKDLEEESGYVNARSMLDNIKVLSSQRNLQEDVFGDSGEDSDSN